MKTGISKPKNSSSTFSHLSPTAVVNRYGRSFKAGLIETKKLIVDGVDILKKLNELSDKSDKQEKTIEAQQTQIDELKELIQAK